MATSKVQKSIQKIVRITIDVHNITIKELSKLESELIDNMKNIVLESRPRKGKVKNHIGKTIGGFSVECIKPAKETEK